MVHDNQTATEKSTRQSPEVGNSMANPINWQDLSEGIGPLNLLPARTFVDQNIDQGNPFRITKGDQSLALADDAEAVTKPNSARSARALLERSINRYNQYEGSTPITPQPREASQTGNSTVNPINRPLIPMPVRPTEPVRPTPIPEKPHDRPSEQSLEQQRAAFRQEMQNHTITDRQGKRHRAAHYTNNEVEKAIQRANDLKLTMVVDIGYPGCPGCDNLNANLFPRLEREEIGNFVSLHLNTNQPGYEEAIAALQQGAVSREIPDISAVPVVLAYSPSGGKPIFNKLGPGSYSAALKQKIHNP